MNINTTMAPIILLIAAFLPALLAAILARKQGRSKFISAIVTFALGFTLIGGWIYLAIMNLAVPKSNLDS